MAQQPNRLQPDTPLGDNLALINDNFDKAVADIADLGSRFSTAATIHLAGVPAGSTVLLPWYVTDSTNRNVAGQTQIIPRMDVRVDVNDADHDLYDGSLTANQRKCAVSVYPKRTPAFGVAEAGGFLTNQDASPHDYYFSFDVSYLNTPTTSTFR